MANWIHRTTARFQKSQDPAPAAQVDWLRIGAAHPADLTGDPDPSHWEVVGDSVVRKDQAVIDAADALRTKESVLAQAMEARVEVAGLQLLKSDIQAAGKAVPAALQDRISVLGAALTAAVASLPAAT
jgi:hypothetical protein